MNVAATGPIALQRCDRFVARTMNWLYDHLRSLPRFTPVVLCDALMNREEFPELIAWKFNWSLTRRAWRRISGARYYPTEWRRIKKLAPRVLHSHFGSVARQDCRMHQALGTPWIVSFYGADIFQRDRAERAKKYETVFRQAERILALGPAMAAEIKELGCPREKIVVHPLGVDVEQLANAPRTLHPGEPLKILFAGTFREKKGVQYVVEAAARARRTGVKLELKLVGDEMGKSGDRETKEAVFSSIRRLGIEDVVTHYPFMPFSELCDLALSCHVFVAPSVTAADGDREGTPFVLQQMMATAMPVISTVHADIPYLFGAHAKWLVAERDAVAIADRLQIYFEEPDRLLADGSALRDQIDKSFNVRHCASHLGSLYQEIASC
jgi:colanic acid/amylovoran biosynthesis glycosyltransferase